MTSENISIAAQESLDTAPNITNRWLRAGIGTLIVLSPPPVVGFWSAVGFEVAEKSGLDVPLPIRIVAIGGIAAGTLVGTLHSRRGAVS